MALPIHRPAGYAKGRRPGTTTPAPSTVRVPAHYRAGSGLAVDVDLTLDAWADAIGVPASHPDADVRITDVLSLLWTATCRAATYAPVDVVHFTVPGAPDAETQPVALTATYDRDTVTVTRRRSETDR